MAVGGLEWWTRTRWLRVQEEIWHQNDVTLANAWRAGAPCHVVDLPEHLSRAGRIDRSCPADNVIVLPDAGSVPVTRD